MSRSVNTSRKLVNAYITGLRQRLPTASLRQLDRLPGATEDQLTRLNQEFPGVPVELTFLLQRFNGTCWKALVAKKSAPPPASGGGGSSSSSSGPADSAAAAAVPTGGAAAMMSSIARAVSGAAPPFADRNLPPKDKIAVPVLGSSLEGYPYYLKSVEKIVRRRWVRNPFPPGPRYAPRQPGSEDETFNPELYQEQQRTMCASESAAAPQPSAAPAAANSAGGGEKAAGQLTTTLAHLYRDYDIDRTVPAEFVVLPLPSQQQQDQQQQQQKVPAPATSPLEVSASAAAEALPSAAAASASSATTVNSANGEKPKCYVDPRIDINANYANWLAFADSINPYKKKPALILSLGAAADTADPSKAGGSDTSASSGNDNDATAKDAASSQRHQQSRLFIDFSPDTFHGGVTGQIIQYARRPERYTVIATDFGELLKYLMAEEYGFIENSEDSDSEDDDDGDSDDEDED